MSSPSQSPSQSPAASPTTGGGYRSEEESRYDRSVRLWGAEAQALLRQGKVLLLGATSTGCEILKNMTLPGLGAFVVVDGRNTELRDLGKNFFLEQSDVGHPRALAVARTLRELNPLVTGEGIHQDEVAFLEGLVAGGHEAVKKFSLIVASNTIPEQKLIELGGVARGTGTPIVHVSAVGFTGVLRIQSDPRYIIHIVPDLDLKVEDMRPFTPFPALQQFIDRLNPDDPEMDDTTHAHLPWFVIVHYAVKKWRQQKNLGEGVLPSKGPEWKDLKEIVLSMMRKKVGGANEDNFIETKDMCSGRLVIQNRGFPELKAILADPRAESPTATDNYFWFLVHGLKRFKAANNDLMPLPGDVPDFHTSTSMYREIQAIFKQKGEEDADEIRRYVVEALTKAGRNTSEATAESVREFAAHAWELNYLTYPSFARQLHNHINPAQLKCKAPSFTHWYVAHNAALKFATKHGRHPGQGSDSIVASDLADLISICKEMCGGNYDAEVEKYLAELTRSGGAEIVSVSAILGAVASQECIKLIQNRRVPIVHSLVYDGIINEFAAVDSAHEEGHREHHH